MQLKFNPATAASDGPKRKTQTFTDLQAEFLMHGRIVRRHSPHTQRNYAASLLKFDFTPEDFNDPRLFTRAIMQLDKSHSVETIRHHISALSVFTNWLVDQGFITQAPHLNLRTARPKNQPLPTAADLSTLKAALEQSTLSHPGALRRLHRNKELMIAILECTGMRVSELVHLSTRDLSVIDPAAHITVCEGKTIAATRTIQVPIALGHAIAAHTAQQSSRLMFVSRTLKPIPASYFDSWLTDYQKPLNLSCAITPHVLRYNYIMQRAAAGDSLFEVMTAVGHTSARQTIHYFNRVRRLMPHAKPNADLGFIEGAE
jgi:integrase/recombinase XerD